MKWIKASYYWDRQNERGNMQGIIDYVDRIDMATVEKSLENYFTEWAGIGKITINWIETGPFREDFLREDEKDSFTGKVYYFNN
ncbi:MAG: hypothetical protein GY774_35570 [Planctomycetes bacterium]|nr:hypothetical protein [Planctomycetota bacterium]